MRDNAIARGSHGIGSRGNGRRSAAVGGRIEIFASGFGRDRRGGRATAAGLLLAGGGSGYFCHGGLTAGRGPERPSARIGPSTAPAPGRHSSRRLGGLLGLLGRGLRATTLVARKGLRGG
eukprot:jgi/Tetstr1/424834/TSEL_015337.t1